MNCVQILTTWGTAKNNLMLVVLILGVVMTMIMVILMTVMDMLMTMMMMV